MERTRRLRTSNYMRDMVRENHVRIDELIYPIFVTEGENIKHPVESMSRDLSVFAGSFIRGN